MEVIFKGCKNIVDQYVNCMDNTMEDKKYRCYPVKQVMKKCIKEKDVSRFYGETK